MKSRFPVAGAAALVLSAAIVAFPYMSPVASAASPRVSAALPVGDLDAVAFRSARLGWVGGSRAILATTDAGRTWTQQYAGPETIARLDFVSNSAGWALGNRSLLRTADAGRTWSPVGDPRNALSRIDFLTPTLGWGVSRNVLYRTQDDGIVWRAEGAPFAVGDVCFVDAQRGWVADASVSGATPLTLAATADGGATWRATAPLPGAAQAGGFMTQTLGCSSANVVWDLVNFGGYAGGVGYALYRSGDGGAHWRIVAHNMAPGGISAPQGPGTEPGDLAVVSAATAYLSGTCGPCGGQGATSVGGTTDGGQSWRNAVVPGLPYATTALSFPSASNGWLVAQWYAGSSQRRSAVLETTDGGRTWQRRYSAPVPTPADMARVTFTLSVYGKVPAGQEFGVYFAAPSGGMPIGVPFCTTIAARTHAGVPRCTGQKALYARDVTFPRGSSVRFSFERFTASTLAHPQVFYSGNRQVSRDTTIAAYYRFAH